MINSKKILKVGTRESKLALIQTEIIIKKLSTNFPEYEFQVESIKTHGDKIQNKPLFELDTSGIFVKELEQELLAKNVDFVVHSLKDLPTDIPKGLILASTPERTDPRDVLVNKSKIKFKDLESNSRIATSSRRRVAQINSIRSDLKFVDVRGNIATRLKKHGEGQSDAMILAAAGLIRLGITELIEEYFDPKLITPAVGQGALAIECRESDEHVLSITQSINDPKTWCCITAERAFLNKLGGGCSVPVGAYAVISNNLLILTASVVSIDGINVYRDTIETELSKNYSSFDFDTNVAQELGTKLANKFIDLGADKIINKLLQISPSVSAP